MRDSFTELRIEARNLSSAVVPGTIERVASGLGIRKLQLWPLDLGVLVEPPEATRCSNRRDFVSIESRR